MTKHTTPFCHNCGSKDLTVTSSQQMRAYDGKMRLHADTICNACKHTWWSVSKALLKLARQADAARVVE